MKNMLEFVIKKNSLKKKKGYKQKVWKCTTFLNIYFNENISSYD